jgi:hypothetical protein
MNVEEYELDDGQTSVVDVNAMTHTHVRMCISGLNKSRDRKLFLFWSYLSIYLGIHIRCETNIYGLSGEPKFS